MPQETLAKRIEEAKLIRNQDEKILKLALLLPEPEVEKFEKFLTALLNDTLFPSEVSSAPDTAPISEQ